MNTNLEVIDQADQPAGVAKQAWAEPQIIIERPLEARADDLPKMFPTPVGRMGPLSTSGGGAGCGNDG